jgi:hypothetical protein
MQLRETERNTDFRIVLLNIHLAAHACLDSPPCEDSHAAWAGLRFEADSGVNGSAV